jgi:hypothetical protein
LVEVTGVHSTVTVDPDQVTFTLVGLAGFSEVVAKVIPTPLFVVTVV